MEKPFDVERGQVFVQLSNDKVGEIVLKSFAKDPVTKITIQQERNRNLGGLLSALFNPFEPKRPQPELNIPYATAVSAFYVIGAATTSIQLAAWNWDFPTPASRTMWRTFGLICVVGLIIPPFSYLSSLYDISGSRSNPHPLEVGYSSIMKRMRIERMIGIILALISALCSLIYVASRVALFVLTLYTISSQPVSAYENVWWTKYLPHFS
jgi:hypothetical protein